MEKSQDKKCSVCLNMMKVITLNGYFQPIHILECKRAIIDMLILSRYTSSYILLWSYDTILSRQSSLSK